MTTFSEQLSNDIETRANEKLASLLDSGMEKDAVSAKWLGNILNKYVGNANKAFSKGISGTAIPKKQFQELAKGLGNAGTKLQGKAPFQLADAAANVKSRADKLRQRVVGRLGDDVINRQARGGATIRATGKNILSTDGGLNLSALPENVLNANTKVTQKTHPAVLKAQAQAKMQAPAPPRPTVKQAPAQPTNNSKATQQAATQSQAQPVQQPQPQVQQQQPPRQQPKPAANPVNPTATPNQGNSTNTGANNQVPPTQNTAGTVNTNTSDILNRIRGAWEQNPYLVQTLAGAGLGGLGGAAHTFMTSDDPSLSEVLKGGLMGAGGGAFAANVPSFASNYLQHGNPFMFKGSEYNGEYKPSAEFANLPDNVVALYDPKHPDYYRANAENISREAPKYFAYADKFKAEHPDMTPEQRKGFENGYNEIKRQFDWAQSYLAGMQKDASLKVRHLFPAAGVIAGAPIGGFIGGAGNVLKTLVKDQLTDGQQLSWDDYSDRARSGMLTGSIAGAGIGGLGGTGLMALANQDNAKAVGDLLRRLGDSIG